MILCNLVVICNMIDFILNDELISTACAPEETVLDFVRYMHHLKGTKIGCREGDCGACTVMVGTDQSGKMEYTTVTSCLMPLGNVHLKHLVTIEGIDPKGSQLSLVQECVADQNGSQCGFCTPGFIMSLTCFAISEGEKSIQNAVKSMDGNICRCTGYKSLERAAGQLTSSLDVNNKVTIEHSIQLNIIPLYFNSISERLKKISNDNTEKKPDNNLTLVAGGTDLYVHHRNTMIRTKANFQQPSRSGPSIFEEDGMIMLDGFTTVTQFLNSSLIRPLFPEMDKHIKLVSSTPIRNMATLAGNFVNASPIGDMTIYFLAIDAEILLEHAGNNWMPLRELYKGYKTLKKGKNEVLLAIRFKKPGPNTLFNFEKVSKRMHLDIASVTTACSLTIENGKITQALISMGGVSPIPMIVQVTSSYLVDLNLPLQEDELSELIRILQTEIAPISDIRGSKEYKRLLASQLLRAHLIEIQKKYAQH